MLQVNLDRDRMLVAGATEEEEMFGYGKDVRMQNYFRFQGKRLGIPKGSQVSLSANDLLWEIPEGFVPFVTEVSYYDHFGYAPRARRQLGEYRHRTATAHLSEVGGQDRHYFLKLRAKNLADLRELHGLIREGKIWPAKDYEAEQVPPPFRNLRNLLAEAWQLIRREVTDRLHRLDQRLKLEP